MLMARKKISSELGEKNIRRFAFPYFITTIRSFISYCVYLLALLSWKEPGLYLYIIFKNIQWLKLINLLNSTFPL